MRNAFVLLTLGSLLAACSGNGCSSSSKGAGAASTTTTSTTTTSTTTSDAGGAGGASAAMVAVRVTDQNQQPISGASVVVNDASGAVVAVGMSGSDGQAPATVPSGGSVTAYYAEGLVFEAVAVFDPPDGATVGIVIQGPALASPNPPAPTSYDEQVSKIPAGASFLTFYTCGVPNREMLFPPSPPSVSYTESNGSCPAYATASFVTVATDATGTPVAWAAALDQPTSPGSLEFVPQVMAQTAFDTLFASMTAIPLNATEASIDLQPAVAAKGPVDFDVLQVASSAVSEFGPSFVTPSGIFASYQVVERVTFTGNGAESHLFRQRSYAHLPATSTFAANAMALMSVAPLDLRDPVHPAVTWSVAEGSRGDYGKVTLSWASGTSTNTYSAVFPSDQPPSFRLPDVPADLSSYAPSPASTFSPVTVDYVDEETAAGYAQCSLFQSQPATDGLGVIDSGGSNQSVAP